MQDEKTCFLHFGGGDKILNECVKMLSTLSYVDNSRNGITGHSQGAESCNVAVVLDNEAEIQLIAAVLIKNLYSQPKPPDGRGIFPSGKANFRRNNCVYFKKI